MLPFVCYNSTLLVVHLTPPRCLPLPAGVILAASVLSAIDAGKKILADSSFDEPSKPAADGSKAPAAGGKADGTPKPPARK